MVNDFSQIGLEESKNSLYDYDPVRYISDRRNSNNMFNILNSPSPQQSGNDLSASANNVSEVDPIIDDTDFNDDCINEFTDEKNQPSKFDAKL